MGILGITGIGIRLVPRRRDRVPLEWAGCRGQTPWLRRTEFWPPCGPAPGAGWRRRPHRPSSPGGRAGGGAWQRGGLSGGGAVARAAGGGTYRARGRRGTRQRHGPDISAEPGRASAQLLTGAALPGLRP